MSKNMITLIVVLVVAGTIIGFAYYMKSLKPNYTWETNYLRRSNQPYGLEYIFKLIKSTNDTVRYINNQDYEALRYNNNKNNIISIDSYFTGDSVNIALVLDYVKKGNNILVASDEAPVELLSAVMPHAGTMYNFDEYQDSAVNISFRTNNTLSAKKLRFNYQYLKKLEKRNWGGYYKSYFDVALAPHTATAISYINDTIVNCFFVPHGKGKIIFHSNPILFTNYSMLKKQGFENANYVFSYLNNTPCYWSEYMTEQSNNNAEDNPLKFLFSHYTLKTGWYLFLISVCAFIVFRSKREQRIIPVMQQNKNTSIEYAKAIGSLYYQKKAHHQIANELHSLFLADMRSKYYIDTSLKQKDLIAQISLLTKTQKEIVENVFELFNDIKYNANATAKDLVKFYQALEFFYNNKR